ncbi:hypothetical protein [Aliivibrio kagoshimensis]|uniref:hypothetical protein n=1 Tax=Aliivibrio kagoshimensis TaxID=2910230 RepID=UPI003D11E7A3
MYKLHTSNGGVLSRIAFADSIGVTVSGLTRLLAPMMMNSKKRIEKRNIERNPTVYPFEVTEKMFSFRETRFEVQDEKELKHGFTV